MRTNKNRRFEHFKEFYCSAAAAIAMLVSTNTPMANVKQPPELALATVDEAGPVVDCFAGLEASYDAIAAAARG